MGLRALALGLMCVFAASLARADGSAVIEFRYTPVARAQVAIWIEDAAGKFLATVALTEAVAFRGIGNRPGASQMNSGYRWPYGRREGVLPIWAHRRAAAPGAKQFARVIFQKREEGYASQTTSDQSKDSYYCLQFDNAKSSKDELDAVSCATQFNSDKGRYMTQADVDMGYSEPFEGRDGAGILSGTQRVMPLYSAYPPRMDAMRCNLGGNTCYNHADVDRFASDARKVMPEIDAVTRATAPGDAPQRVLFSVPSSWAQGDYVAWIEVNVEGDYNDDQGSTEARMMGWNSTSYPTPSTPDGDWDYYAKAYGYPYRGQPSLAYKVPFKLGMAGEQATYSDAPAGRSSWEHWVSDYGKLEGVTFSEGAARHMSDQNGSGADRLRRDAQGHRLSIVTKITGELAEPTVPDPELDAGTEPVAPGDGDGSMPMQAHDAGMPQAGAPAEEHPNMADPVDGPDGVVLPDSDDALGKIGPIEGLHLRPHPNFLRTHSWIMLSFRAARSDAPLLEYEVRVAKEPIYDEDSFIRVGRPAKDATDDAEGSTALMLPVNVAPGATIEAAMGDLVADTQYYVAVRATDENNRHGPISVAEITTTVRRFATVTPCFIATAAYGTPLASEIGVLRQLRDRNLRATAPGRALVAAYERFGPPAARVIARDERLRGLVRGLLSPIVSLLQKLR